MFCLTCLVCCFVFTALSKKSCFVVIVYLKKLYEKNEIIIVIFNAISLKHCQFATAVCCFMFFWIQSHIQLFLPFGSTIQQKFINALGTTYTKLKDLKLTQRRWQRDARSSMSSQHLDCPN